MSDPIEGREYGATTAKFYWNNGKPVIHSLAHGQDSRYFLHEKQLESTKNQQQPAYAAQGEQPPPYGEARPPPRGENAQNNLANTKTGAIAALLGNVIKTNLRNVCVNLDWKAGTDGKEPKQKHYKIAIIHTLIKTAKKHNWYIVHDTGFFHIYNGALWLELTDAEVKKLLEDAAVKIGYDRIECMDADFVEKLFKQAIIQGFFTGRVATGQSIINLSNGSLVLNEGGVTLKPFDHRDFLYPSTGL